MFSTNLEELAAQGRLPRWKTAFGFSIQAEEGSFSFALPHWFALVAFGVIAAVPWIRWSNRFSLRTLLIATTLAALVLAMVVTTS